MMFASIMDVATRELSLTELSVSRTYCAGVYAGRNGQSMEQNGNQKVIFQFNFHLLKDLGGFSVLALEREYLAQINSS